MHPVTVTLTFSSIVDAVRQLSKLDATTAVVGLPGVVGQATEGNAQPAKDKVVDKPKADPKPAAQESAPAAAAVNTAAVETKADAPSAKPATTQPQADGELAYEVLQKAVFALAGKSKAAALEVNASFGVKTMKDLPVDRRREALAAVNAKLASLETEAEVA